MKLLVALLCSILLVVLMIVFAIVELTGRIKRLEMLILHARGHIDDSGPEVRT